MPRHALTILSQFGLHQTWFHANRFGIFYAEDYRVPFERKLTLRNRDKENYKTCRKRALVFVEMRGVWLSRSLRLRLREGLVIDRGAALSDRNGSVVLMRE